MYRVYEYPSKTIPYKHVYLKRCSTLTDKRKTPYSEELTVAERNSQSILEELDAKEKLKQSVSRSRRVVRDLILCNDFDFFCTFTFNPDKVDRFDYESCRKKLVKFFNNFKNRYAPDFKYLVIPEEHEKGGYHFHGVLSGMPDGEIIVPETVFYKDKFTYELVMKPNVKKYRSWPRYENSFGFFNCSPIQNHDACAFYITKYITKDLCKMPVGRSVYFCSHGLRRPELVFSDDDMPMIFEPAYENEYCAIAFENDCYTNDCIPDYSWTEFEDADSIWPTFAFYDSGVQQRLGE